MKQRIIILAGLLPGLVVGALGFLNGFDITHIDATAITGIGTAVGVVSAALVVWARSTAEEIVYTVLASLAGVVGACITIANLVGLTDLPDDRAGAIVGVLTLFTGAAITLLRGEVTSPANVADLEAQLADARGA